MSSFLQGYGTYIVAGLGLLTGILNQAGVIDANTAKVIYEILGPVGVATMRRAIGGITKLAPAIIILLFITPSYAQTETPTDTPTSTPTSTITPTNTPTDSPTPTLTRTNTPTNSPTKTPTNTPTRTNTPTSTATATNTPIMKDKGITNQAYTHVTALELTLFKDATLAGELDRPRYSDDCIAASYAPRNLEKCRCVLYTLTDGSGSFALRMRCPQGSDMPVYTYTPVQ